MIVKNRIHYRLIDEDGRTYTGTVFTELDHADFLGTLRKKYPDAKSVYSEWQGSIEEPELSLSAIASLDMMCFNPNAVAVTYVPSTHPPTLAAGNVGNFLPISRHVAVVCSAPPDAPNEPGDTIYFRITNGEPPNVNYINWEW